MAPRGDLQLAIGYWIVSHRQTLRTWWAIVLMGFTALSLLWVVIFFTLFFTQDGKVNGLLTQAATGAGSFRSASQPQPLLPGEATIVTRDPQHIDLVADLANPNAGWASPALTAHFVVDGTALPLQHLFLNQGATRPIVQLNVTVKDSATASASLVVDETAWALATVASLPEPQFTVSELAIVPSAVTFGGEQRTTVTLTAQVTNTSVYNFYHVIVPIILIQDDRIVGVDQVDLERWPTLTAKTLNRTWSYPIAGATTAKIEPQVSRFDANNTYR